MTDNEKILLERIELLETEILEIKDKIAILDIGFKSLPDIAEFKGALAAVREKLINSINETKEAIKIDIIEELNHQHILDKIVCRSQ